MQNDKNRYGNGHAISHFEETQHNFSLEVSSHRVWDYVADQHVHRLAASMGDGKLVQLARSPDRRQRRGRGDEAAQQKMSMKLEQLLVEYNHLLASQMEQQRQYFRHQLRTANSEHKCVVVEEEKEVKQQRDLGDKLTRRIGQLRKALSTEQKGALALEAQMVEAKDKGRKLKVLNQTLLTAQGKLRDAHTEEKQQQQTVLRAKDDEIDALSEELRDLRFYISSQAKVAHSSIEAQELDGSVNVVVAEDPQKPRRKKKKRR